jgi:uncharacterized HAD superfamily protein
MKQQKTIAVDIDDVLSRSAEGFIAFSNQQWGHSLSPDDYQEEWAVVWGVPLEEALKRSIVYHASGAVGNYQPHEAALPVLQRLAKHYKLVTVTSRREILKPETDRWIELHFPGIFQELHYAGIWDKELTGKNVQQTLKRSKADLLRQIRADYLIDDHPKHCLGAAEAGIPAILFGTYSWNRGIKDLPKNVTRALTWDDIARYFDV